MLVPLKGTLMLSPNDTYVMFPYGTSAVFREGEPAETGLAAQGEQAMFIALQYGRAINFAGLVARMVVLVGVMAKVSATAAVGGSMGCPETPGPPDPSLPKVPLPPMAGAPERGASWLKSPKPSNRMLAGAARRCLVVRLVVE